MSEPNIVYCSDCRKKLDIAKLGKANKHPECGDYFCNDCLDECISCGQKFADYDGNGICDECMR